MSSTPPQDMKKLLDDLRVIQSEQMQLENVSEKLTELRNEFDRKVIYKDQLLGREDVRSFISF